MLNETGMEQQPLPTEPIDIKARNVFTMSIQTNDCYDNHGDSIILKAIYHLKEERRQLQEKLQSNQYQINFLKSKLSASEKSNLDCTEGGDNVTSFQQSSANDYNEDFNLLHGSELKQVLQELKSEIKCLRENVRICEMKSFHCGKEQPVLPCICECANSANVPNAQDAQTELLPCEANESNNVSSDTLEIDVASYEQMPDLEKCLEQCTKLKSHNSEILELIKSLEAVKRETHTKQQENSSLLTENNRLESELSKMEEICANERKVSEMCKEECKTANEMINKLELDIKEMNASRESLQMRLEEAVNALQQSDNEKEIIQNNWTNNRNALHEEIEQIKFELVEHQSKQIENDEKRKKSFDNMQVKVDYLCNCLEHTQECANILKQSSLELKF